MQFDQLVERRLPFQLHYRPLQDLDDIWARVPMSEWCETHLGPAFTKYFYEGRWHLLEDGNFCFSNKMDAMRAMLANAGWIIFSREMIRVPWLELYDRLHEFLPVRVYRTLGYTNDERQVLLEWCTKNFGQAIKDEGETAYDGDDVLLHPNGTWHLDTDDDLWFLHDGDAFKASVLQGFSPIKPADYENPY